MCKYFYAESRKDRTDYLVVVEKAVEVVVEVVVELVVEVGCVEAVIQSFIQITRSTA